MNVNNIMDLGGSQSASKSSKTSSSKSRAASSELFKSIYGQKQTSSRQSGLDIQSSVQQQSGKTNTQQTAAQKDTTVQDTSSKNDTAPVNGNESAPAEDLEKVATTEDAAAEDVNVSEPESDEPVMEDENAVAGEVSEEETEEPQDTDVQTPIFVMQMPTAAPMIATVIINQETPQTPSEPILNEATLDLVAEQPQLQAPVQFEASVVTEEVQFSVPVQTEENVPAAEGGQAAEITEEPVLQVTDALKDVASRPAAQPQEEISRQPQEVTADAQPAEKPQEVTSPQPQTETSDEPKYASPVNVEQEVPREDTVQQPKEITENEAPAVTAEEAPVHETAKISTEADKFASQVVKEAKDMVREPIQETGRDAVMPEEEIERPVAAKENADDMDDTANKGSEQGKTTQPTVTPGTAQITEDGRVDFHTSAAQPLEAEHYMQPENRQMIMNRVVEQVRSAVSPDRTEFYIQLKPDFLGGLSIGLVAEEKGIVAKIMTTSQQVHNALQADMTALQQVLRDRGINVVEMEVIYNNLTDSAMQDNSNGQQQQFSQSGRRNQGRTAEIADEALTMYDTLSAYEVLAENGGSVEFNA